MNFRISKYSPSPPKLTDTTNESTPIAQIYGYTVLMGFGSGAYLMAGYAVVEKIVGPEELSNAVGFMVIGEYGHQKHHSKNEKSKQP